MQLEGADWPAFGWTKDIRAAVRTAREAARPFVLGMLVGSTAPRRAMQARMDQATFATARASILFELDMKRVY